jgi:hypothetical protein
MQPSSTIRKAMKSTNLSVIITTSVAILLLALLTIFGIKPLYNHFAGPFDVTAEELISYQGPQDTLHTNVIAHPSVALDTQFYYYEAQEDGSEKILHSYYALLIDDRLLLAKYPGNNRGDILDPEPVSGKIVSLTETEKTEILQTLISEFPNLQDAFLPYMLDTTPNNTPVWSMIIGIAVLAALSIWSLITLIRRTGLSSGHPIAKNLSRYGDWQQMAQEIDTQMAEPHETHGEYFHLTADWLIYQSKNRFEAIPYRDLIWQYMFQVTYRPFGIVTGRVYSLMVNDRLGKTKSLLYGKDSEAVMDLTKKLQAHAPWAYAGYSPELQNAWNQERENMIATVDARKQEIEDHQVPTDTDTMLESDYPEPEPDQPFEQELNATPSDSE